MATLSYSAILTDRQRSGRVPHVRDGTRNKLVARDVSFWYGPKQALFDITLSIPERSVMALIGPSGCGKSTFLRMLNRMNDLIPTARHFGNVLLDDRDIYSPGTDLVTLRRRVGTVFQKSTTFPNSVFENVVFGPRIAGVRNRAVLREICEG